MKAQFKYAVLQSLALRLTAFAEVVLMNVIFGILGYYRFWGSAGMITAVTLSSVALCGILVVNIIADSGSLKSIFGAPDAYLHALTPVKSWKILLARTVTLVLEDFIALTVGIIGVVWQSFILSGLIGHGMDYSSYETGPIGDIVSGALVILLGYAYIVMLIVFGMSIKNSVFFGVRGKSWLAALSVAAVAWIFNLFNFVLAPLGRVEHWGIFYSITLPFGLYAAFVVYALLFSVKIAALFIASCTLIERKNNL